MYNFSYLQNVQRHISLIILKPIYKFKIIHFINIYKS